MGIMLLVKLQRFTHFNPIYAFLFLLKVDCKMVLLCAIRVFWLKKQCRPWRLYFRTMLMVIWLLSVPGLMRLSTATSGAGVVRCIMLTHLTSSATMIIAVCLIHLMCACVINLSWFLLYEPWTLLQNQV